MKQSRGFCSIILAALLPVIAAQSPGHEALLESIFKDYRDDLLPHGGPIRVGITMHISHLDVMGTFTAETTPSFVVQLYLRETYQDPRLAYRTDPLYQKYGNIDSIIIPKNQFVWHPDTFFANEINASPIERSEGDFFRRVDPNGNIVISTRLKHVFTCPMTTFYFPYCRFSCSMELESYGYSTRHIVYVWAMASGAVTTGQMAVRGFILESVEEKERFQLLSTGNYSRLSVIFKFRRSQSARHMLELFFAPGGFFLVALFALAMDNWKTYGLIVVISMFAAFMAVVTQVYTSFPLARYSIVHHWISGCGFLILLEAVMLFGMVIASKKYDPDVQPAAVPKRISFPSGNETVEEHRSSSDQYSLLYTIPNIRSERRLFVLLRVGVFLLLLAVFIIMSLVIGIAIANQ